MAVAKKDYTSGPLFKNIILFALPLMASGMLQFLFNSADQIVVGKFASTESLAAVGSNGPLIGLLLNLFLGLGMGANVVIARAIGEKDEEKISRTVHTAYLFGVISGVIMTVACFFLARPLLTLIRCDGAVIDKAETYLKIYFLGLPATIIYNFGSSALRAKGDTKNPLIYLAIGGVVNVAFNLFFVIVCKLDVVGVALATVIAQYLSLALVTVHLIREKDATQLCVKKLKIYKRELKEMAIIGVPSGLSGACFSIGNIVMQSAVNTLGSTAMAAGTISSTLDGFVYISMNSLAQAAVTFVGQNYGAQKSERIKRTIALCCALVAVVWAVLAAFTVFGSSLLIGLFTNDAEVAETARKVIVMYIPLYFLCGFMETFINAMRGMGKTVVPTIFSLIFVCAFRIVWTFAVFPIFGTLEGLYLSHPISWAACLICFVVIFMIYYKKMKKEFARSGEVKN